MAVLTKSMLDSLITGDTTLMDIFGGKFGVAEKPQELEHTPSDTRKWIKELSALGNIVVFLFQGIGCKTCYLVRHNLYSTVLHQ